MSTPSSRPTLLSALRNVAFAIVVAGATSFAGAQTLTFVSRTVNWMQGPSAQTPGPADQINIMLASSGEAVASYKAGRPGEFGYVYTMRNDNAVGLKVVLKYDQQTSDGAGLTSRQLSDQEFVVNPGESFTFEKHLESNEYYDGDSFTSYYWTYDNVYIGSVTPLAPTTPPLSIQIIAPGNAQKLSETYFRLSVQ